jgi:hypothetical protein
VKPDTVIRSQRKRFKEHWRRLSRSGDPGRPSVPEEVKELIRSMSSMNPTWGAPRFVGEHVIVFSENHLRRILAAYVAYYNGSRTHLSLEMDSPIARPVQTPDEGNVIVVPQVGGLHHRYERRAA